MDIEWAKDGDGDKGLVKNKLEELAPGFAIDLVDLIELSRISINDGP
jgi:hypothetical protein